MIPEFNQHGKLFTFFFKFVLSDVHFVKTAKNMVMIIILLSDKYYIHSHNHRHHSYIFYEYQLIFLKLYNPITVKQQLLVK